MSFVRSHFLKLNLPPPFSRTDILSGRGVNTEKTADHKEVTASDEPPPAVTTEKQIVRKQAKSAAVVQQDEVWDMTDVLADEPALELAKPTEAAAEAEAEAEAAAEAEAEETAAVAFCLH